MTEPEDISAVDKFHELRRPVVSSTETDGPTSNKQALHTATLIAGTIQGSAPLPFSEETRLSELPSYMKKFYVVWREKLSEDTKYLVTAHQLRESKEWYVKIGERKIFIQNLSAEKESATVRIKDIPGMGRHTYFKFMQAHEIPERRMLPSDYDWEQMALLVGGWHTLIDLLQIHIVSHVPNILENEADDWKEASTLVGQITMVRTSDKRTSVLFCPDYGEIFTDTNPNSYQIVRLMLREGD